MYGEAEVDTRVLFFRTASAGHRAALRAPFRFLTFSSSHVPRLGYRQANPAARCGLISVPA